MLRVFTTPAFEKEKAKALTLSEQSQLLKVISDLKRGRLRGKKLKGGYLWELKFGGKRVYYLYYQSYAVLFVATSVKSDQQDVIEGILLRLEEFRKLVFD